MCIVCYVMSCHVLIEVSVQGFFDSAVGSGKNAATASAMALSVDEAADLAGDGWGDDDEEDVDVPVDGEDEKKMNSQMLPCMSLMPHSLQEQ